MNGDTIQMSFFDYFMEDEQTFEHLKDNIVNTMKDKSETNISIEEVDLDEDIEMEMELI